MSEKIVFKRAEIKLSNPKTGEKILVVIWFKPPQHRPDNLNYFVNDWLKVAEKYTAQDLVNFINSQIPKIAMTEQEFEELRES